MTAPLPDSPPVSRARRRWIIAAVAVAILIAILAWIFRPPPEIIISRETTYITAPLRSDGRPDYVRYLNEKSSEGVTPENNAAVLLYQAVDPEAIPESVRDRFYSALQISRPRPGDYLETSPPDPPERQAGEPRWNEWFAKNDKAVAMLEAAGLRSEFHIPLLTGDGSSEFRMQSNPTLNDERYAVQRIFGGRALFRMYRGDLDGALADVRILQRWGQLFRRRGYSYLVGQPLLLEELKVARHLLLSGKMSASQLRSLRQTLSELPGENPHQRDLEQERVAQLSRITDAWQREMPDVRFAPGVDPNELLRTWNAHLDRNEANMQIANPAECRAALESHAADIRALDARLAPPVWRQKLNDIWRRFFPRPQDEVFIDERFVIRQVRLSFPRAESEDRLRAELDLAIIAAAVLEFKLRFERLPNSLEELVPGELDEMPIDPWTGKPYVYLVEGEKFAVSTVREYPRLEMAAAASRLTSQPLKFGTLK